MNSIMRKVSKASSIIVWDKESGDECSVVADAEAPEKGCGLSRWCVGDVARHAAPTTRDVGNTFNYPSG